MTSSFDPDLVAEILTSTDYPSPSTVPSIDCFDVVGVGQCALDVLGRLSDYPPVDTKSELNELLVQGGGPVATALVALSRLGAATAFCGKIGDDDFGRRIREGLEVEGVDCRGLLNEKGATSQFAFIAVDGAARRNIFWYRGSATPLHPEAIDSGLLKRCKVLHLDGLLNEASLAAARIARSAGVITVLDGGSVREGTMELLPWIDHLVVSEKFIFQMSPDASVRRGLERLLEYGANAVTATFGERGSDTLTRSGRHFHQPAFAVDALDTTGCGDVFHGGYIYGLLQRWPLERVVRFAAACAALKTTALGGRTSIPSLDRVEAFLCRAPGSVE